MRFLSTRGGAPGARLEEALQNALAPDGGLYVPETLPRFEPSELADSADLPDIAVRMLTPFFADSALATDLPAIAKETLAIPSPLVPLGSQSGAWVLELYHGPTAAFKDFGARFLAGCLSCLGTKRRTILVATSGDTGGAVAAAFHRRPGTRVILLYPAGGVSPRQEHQLGCWGDNVSTLRVRGTFDDCQALVTSALADIALRTEYGLASANSINLGRLLPQTTYYAAASLAHWRATGRRVSFIVPTGNLGNGVACVWARAMGLPIEDIVFATNANRVIPDFLRSGTWQARPSIATLASAMDVGNPNNMARLLAFAGGADGVRSSVGAAAVDDDTIRLEIAATFRESGRIVCPHTATALRVLRELAPHQRAGRDWVAVATAHPAKFDTVVEAIIGRTVPVPAALATLLEQPSHAETIEARLDALIGVIRRG